MATLIGDFIGDHSRFHHTMHPASGISYQQQHSHEPAYQSPSRPRDAPSRHHSSTSSSSSNHNHPEYRPSAALSAQAHSHTGRSASQEQPFGSADHAPAPPGVVGQQPGAESALFPTPPDSASPHSPAPAHSRSQHAPSSAYMASTDPALNSSAASSTSTVTVVPASRSTPQAAIPSPASDPTWSPSVHNSQHGAVADTAAGSSQAQRTIRVNDLAHIQTLAGLDLVPSAEGGLSDSAAQDIKFDISGMPIGDVIEMVAALLTKITTTNDLQHDALNRNVNHQRQAQAQSEGSESHSSPFSTSVLAFHGKNVPAITILSYLSRIHKYCPTTYEVFLSLLVYFDRMTERVNDMVMKDEQERRKSLAERRPTATSSADVDTPMENAGHHESDESDEDLADDSSDEDDDDAGSGKGKSIETHPARTASAHDSVSLPSATYFVVDSFNIHRLIIAGVTCASKFFSDVFYTNSRYAKVGGLPLAELNHLELQFLLLNDFRLAVPVEDLEAYATMLVEFYAREVIAHRPRAAAAAAGTSEH